MEITETTRGPDIVNIKLKTQVHRDLKHLISNTNIILKVNQSSSGFRIKAKNWVCIESGCAHLNTAGQ